MINIPAVNADSRIKKLKSSYIIYKYQYAIFPSRCKRCTCSAYLSK